MKRIVLSFVLTLSACLATAQTGAPARGIKAREIEATLGPDAPVPRYHALVIGVSEYKHCQDLPQARKDAERLAAILKNPSGYNFAGVTTLYDEQATRRGILGALYDAARGMTAADSLLIYYAGHGYFDRALENGYWIPSDGPEPASGRLPVEDWVEDTAIKDRLSRTQARHVLLVSDSCFGGALLRSVTPDLSRRANTYYRTALTQPARYVLSSGDLQEVPDQSVFSQKFIEVLQFPRQAVFSASDIAHWIRNPVAEATGCQPRFGQLRSTTGNDAGEFVFLALSDITFIPESQIPPKPTRTDAGPASAPTATGGFYVETDPPGALVAVGAHDMQKSPHTFRNLPAGTVRVEVTLDGHEPERFDVTIPAGGFARRTDIKLRRQIGTVQILSTPGNAAIALDGARLTQTTPVSLTVPIGKHTVELSRDGYESAQRTVEVQAGRTAVCEVTLEQVKGTRFDQPWTADLGGGVTMRLQPIAAGSFQMGSNNGDSDEKPVRTVRITRPFWMGRTEVTQAQWQNMMGNNPSHFKGNDLPVETVSWDQAVAFCQKLTQRERQAGRLPQGYEYRLPTEAEWEYACRSGTTGDYAGDLDAVAWYTANAGGKTQPVGTKQANAWGLHDMHGNVWEWCLDWYADSYTGAATTDPQGPSTGSYRVFRGGSWYLTAANCRSAFRSGYGPSVTYNGLGFRAVLAPVL